MRSLLLISALACVAPVDDSDKPSDTDADTDSDTDSDTDADTDSDTDADSDTDTDIDTDVPPDVGPGVLLYIGNGGGSYDIYEDELEALYDGAGHDADVSESLPGGLADDYGVVLVLSPSSGFPATTELRELLDRGGRVVVVTEHGSYGDHAGATAFLADLGSTLRSVQASNTGTQALSVTSTPPLTEGVDALELYYCADIDIGDGRAVASRDDGEPAIGWEAVRGGDVLLVPDGSLFGYVLDNADNARLLTNLARVE